jgi:two-component system sensor histidine kinase YesM
MHMRRLIALYRNRLAAKQFLFLFAVVSLLFISLAYSNLHDAKSIMKEQVIADSEVLVNRTNQLLNAYMENIQNVLQLLINSQETYLLGDRTDIQKTFRAYTENVGSLAKTLYFIREDGKVFSSRQTQFDVFGNEPLLSQYQSIRQNYGAINWSEPYYSPVSGRTIAFVRPVLNKQQQIVGTAIVEIDTELLSARLGSLHRSGYQSFALVTSQNEFVSFDIDSTLLPFEYESYKKRLEPSFARQLFDLSEGANEVVAKDSTLIAVKSQSNRMNWRVISLMDERFFYKNIDRLNRNHLKAAFFWFIILAVSVGFLSRHITQPIRMLVTKMNRIREFQTAQPITIDRDDEIGELTKSYNSLLTRVQMLIKDIQESEHNKKQYELKMLQSQIGPHFLYNTLACVSSLAKQGKVDEVRETIRSLGSLLRYSFDKTSEYVTLGEELTGLKQYTQIQQVRYGNQFQLIVDINPELLSCPILKLTLQPIVENAIYHGIIPKGQAGTIWISGRAVEGGRVKLYVIDDGVGIARDSRRSLLYDRKEPPSHEAFNSVGLINVHQRLRLHFGESYGLRICSRKDMGTVVRVEIPAKPLLESG